MFFSDSKEDKHVLIYSELCNRRFDMLDSYIMSNCREDVEKMFIFVMELAFECRNLQVVQICFLMFFSLKKPVLEKIVQRVPARGEFLMSAVSDLVNKVMYSMR